MKKIIFAVFFITISIFANAQDFNFGIVGGMNISNLAFKAEDYGLSADEYDHMKSTPDIGCFGGLVFEYESAEGVIVGAESIYNNTKYKMRFYESKWENKNDYITIPIYVGYKHYITPMSRIVINGGGAVNCALKGDKGKTAGSIYVGCGFEYNKVRILANYNYFLNKGAKINGVMLGISVFF